MVDLDTSALESSLRLLLAAACGGLVGWDRETRGHDAGFRTHIMVALGAASFTLVAMELFEALDRAGTSVDPVRVIAGIVGGVGFLGAGTIMQANGKVKGLTTAAGLWVIAAAGIAAGIGAYLNAIMVSVLAFLTLNVLRRIEPQDNGDGGGSSSRKTSGDGS